MRSLALFIVMVAGSAIVRAEELTSEQQLIDACYRLNQYRVIRLLRDGVDVNATYGLTDPIRYRPEWTPLLALAASYCESSLTDFESGRDQRPRAAADPRTDSLKRMAIARILLSHGCDVDACDSTGETALHAFIRNRDAELAKLILLFEPDVNTWAKSEYLPRESPLHSAHWSPELSAILLERGAIANVSDAYRATAGKALYLQQLSNFVKSKQREPSDDENEKLGYDPEFNSVLLPNERIARDLDSARKPSAASLRTD